MIFDDSILTEARGSDSPDVARLARRTGLAPVEMMLVLPLLMLMMATIIAFGYAASWKVRSEVVARDVAWRSRYPRSASNGARAREWPVPGTMGVGGGSPIASFDDDAILQAPIIRGPIPNVNVNSRVLNFSRSVDSGNASIVREPPILPRLGRINYRTRNNFLDDRFQCYTMGIGNNSRRIPVIYEIDLDFVRDSAAILNAIAAIERVRPPLLALDEDQEFIDWYQHRCGARDFHPRIRRFESLDVDYVRQRYVQPLLGRIDNVPQTMARASISLYRQQLQAIPPPSQAVQNELQRKIDALEEYLDRLRNR